LVNRCSVKISYQPDMANQNNRQVRITYVGERENYVKMSRAFSRSSDLSDIDFSLTLIPTSSVSSEIPSDDPLTSVDVSLPRDEVDEKIMDSEPNMVILDYKSLPRSVTRAGHIRGNRKLSHVKTLVRTNFEELANQVMLRTQDPTPLSFGNKRGIDELVVEDEGEDRDITKLVRGLCYKPLSVGVVGLGTFGMDLVKLLDHEPYVDTIIVWSEHAPAHRVLDVLESTDKNFIVVSSLEELASFSQVLVMCSSSLSKEECVRIARNPDRSDLFPYEKDKIEGYWQRISEAVFEGIVMDYGNPIGNRLDLLRTTNMNPRRGTSSFAVDVRRLMGCLPLPEHYDTDTIDIIERGIVGHHGIPRLVTDKVPPAIIAIAQDGARRVGYRSQAAAGGDGCLVEGKLRTSASESVWASRFFMEDLANYNRSPRYNVYCYHEDPEIGFAAVPAIYDPKEGTFVPDEKMIDLIGREKIYSILRQVRPKVQ